MEQPGQRDTAAEAENRAGAPDFADPLFGVRSFACSARNISTATTTSRAAINSLEAT
jgi:hypothetical protein